MKIGLNQGYILPMALPFSFEFQAFVSRQIESLVDASPLFLQKYDHEYAIHIRMSVRGGTDTTNVLGPDIYRITKELEFGVHLPFDVILRADDGPRCALRFLFEGIRTILQKYDIATAKLDANEKQIIETICADPQMFDTNWVKGPWPTLANYKPPPPPAPEDPTRPAFQRLYKRIDGVLHYESVFAHSGVALHHTGKVGSKGKTKELPFAGTPKKAVDTFLGVARAKGFSELPEEHEIEIQYDIADFGSEQDLEKLHALEDHLHNLLGDLGLGVCHENSIGGGTMEVSCYVVDADIAMKNIKKALKGTRFADYARIHIVEPDEDDED